MRGGGARSGDNASIIEVSMLSGPNCSELVGKDLRVDLGEKVFVGARNDALTRNR